MSLSAPRYDVDIRKFVQQNNKINGGGTKETNASKPEFIKAEDIHEFHVGKVEGHSAVCSLRKVIAQSHNFLVG